MFQKETTPIESILSSYRYSEPFTPVSKSNQVHVFSKTMAFTEKLLSVFSNYFFEKNYRLRSIFRISSKYIRNGTDGTYADMELVDEKVKQACIRIKVSNRIGSSDWFKVQT